MLIMLFANFNCLAESKKWVVYLAVFQSFIIFAC